MNVWPNLSGLNYPSWVKIKKRPNVWSTPSTAINCMVELHRHLYCDYIRLRRGSRVLRTKDGSTFWRSAKVRLRYSWMTIEFCGQKTVLLSVFSQSPSPILMCILSNGVLRGKGCTDYNYNFNNNNNLIFLTLHDVMRVSGGRVAMTIAIAELQQK